VSNVANPRKPLRLNVGFIINSTIGYSRDFEFSFPVYQDEDLSMAKVEGVAKVGRTPQGLIVQGNFSGSTTLECVRCLSEYQQWLEWEFTELYAFKPENVAESGLLVPDDAHIDLQPLVREFALLEFPIKPLCREDCKGLCTECGQNLNEKDCGHRPEIDSPFLALKNLLENRADEDQAKK
jgi:uncharacterized protein